MRGAGAVLFVATLALPSCKQPAPRPLGTMAPAVDARPAYCVELRGRLCTQFGPSSDVCTLAEEKTRRFSPDGCLRMLSHYESTAATALRYVEARQILRRRAQLTPHGPAPTVGSDAAPLTLVVFADFTDHECGRAAGMATTIKNLYADKARLIFRQYPLAIHPDAHLAAEASLAAHAQGKFWAFHEVLFGNPQAQDRAALERYAEAVGLDLPRFRAALDRHTFAADVDADLRLGHDLDIGAVPALFANGRSVAVPYGAAELRQLVEAETRPGPGGGTGGAPTEP